MAGWWTNERQRQAYNYLVSAGLSTFGAAGLVSRWVNVESTAQGPYAINPSSGAFGIAQWLTPGRLNPIRGNTDFNAQLAYVVRELNSTEARAGAVLRSAKSIQEGARGASMYERAEGYNSASGTDNWTARTAAGISNVLAIAGGLQSPPFIADAYTDAPLTAQNLTTPLLLGAGALLLFLYASQ